MSVVVSHIFVVMDSEEKGEIFEIPLCAGLVSFVSVVIEERRNAGVNEFTVSRCPLHFC